MKKLCSSEAFSVLPTQNGIIICTEKPAADNKVIVSYNKYTKDDGVLSPVPRSVYLMEKFGYAYKEIFPQIKGYITASSMLLSDQRVLVVDKEGAGKVFNSEGQLVREKSFVYREKAPAQMIVHNNALWAVYSELDCIVRYNIDSFQMELRIGGGKNRDFCRPVSICGVGDELFVCNAETRKISIVNPDEYSVIEYAELSEPIHQYIKIGSTQLMLLDSGVYRL